MRPGIISKAGRPHRTSVLVGFVVAAFLGFLFFGDQVGAISAGKIVRTGVQTPGSSKS